MSSVKPPRVYSIVVEKVAACGSRVLVDKFINLLFPCDDAVSTPLRSNNTVVQEKSHIHHVKLLNYLHYLDRLFVENFRSYMIRLLFVCLLSLFCLFCV